MVVGMATSKITVTLHNDQLDEIRALMNAGQTPNISAFIQHAVRIALHDAEGWEELLQGALEQTGGPITPKERKWADAILGYQPLKKGSGKGHAA